MLLIGLATGLACGILAGGRLSHLLSVRLRFALLILVALVLRLGTQALIAADVEVVDVLRLPLFGLAFGLLIGTLWLNRSQPGLLVAMIGVACNGLAVVVNAGWMPVYMPALAVAGMTPSDLSATFHVPLPETIDLEFLLKGGPVGDILPLPLPILANVISVGDVLLASGMAWFLFSSLVYGQPDADAGGISLWRGSEPATLPPAPRAALDRPVVLGGGMGPGLSSSAPVVALIPGAGPAIAAPAPPRPVRAPSLGERVRAHPYVRLARDARFGAFWLAQTISIFGDRLNQIALGVMVYGVTGSALQTGFVFLAATLPNLLLGPIAGTFVDRWDQKRVMVVSDLARAGLVLLVPFLGEDRLWLIYPLVFLVTTVSLFFRPARSAVLPRIVATDDLMPANGAIWTGETLADIIGYPLAGLLVAFLGTNLALAFWLDAATYVVSAALIAGLAIPPLAREMAPRIGGAVRAFMDELREGWRFLRSERTLYQNTVVSVIAQLSIGSTLALGVVYARDSLDGTLVPYPESYAALETAIGIGNVVGGFIVGAIGLKARKGRLVVTGFTGMGLATVLLGLTSSDALAIGACLVIGFFNLIYVIPTQTLFAQRTPAAMMGRVVAMRSSLVLGALTGAMAISSIVAERTGAGPVLAVAGAITVVAGLLAAALPAVRDA